MDIDLNVKLGKLQVPKSPGKAGLGVKGVQPPPNLESGFRKVFNNLGRDFSHFFGKVTKDLNKGLSSAKKERRAVYERNKGDTSDKANRERAKADTKEERARRAATRRNVQTMNQLGNAVKSLQQPFDALKDVVSKINPMTVPIGAATAAMMELGSIGKQINKTYYEHIVSLEAVDDVYDSTAQDFSHTSKALSELRTGIKMPFEAFGGAIKSLTSEGKGLKFLGDTADEQGESLKLMDYYAKRSGKSLGETSKQMLEFNRLFGETGDSMIDSFDRIIQYQEGSKLGLEMFTNQVMQSTKSFYLWGDNSEKTAKTLNLLSRSGNLARETLASFGELKGQLVDKLSENMGILMGTQYDTLTATAKDEIEALKVSGTKEDLFKASMLESQLEMLKLGDQDAMKGLLGSLDEDALADFYLKAAEKVMPEFDKDKLEGGKNTEQVALLRQALKASGLGVPEKFFRMIVGMQKPGIGEKKVTARTDEEKKAQQEFRDAVNQKMLTANDILGMNSAFEAVFMTMGEGLDGILAFTSDILQKGADIMGMGDMRGEIAAKTIRATLEKEMERLKKSANYQNASEKGRIQLERDLAKKVALQTTMGHARYADYERAKRVQSGAETVEVGGKKVEYTDLASDVKSIYDQIITEVETGGIIGTGIAKRFDYDKLRKGSYALDDLVDASSDAFSSVEDLIENTEDKVKKIDTEEEKAQAKKLNINFNLYRTVETKN